VADTLRANPTVQTLKHERRFTSYAGQADTQAKIFFPNGYGASVLHGPLTHDMYEIAVLKGDSSAWDICYDTPITNNVLPHCTDEDVNRILLKIKKLPPA